MTEDILLKKASKANEQVNMESLFKSLKLKPMQHDTELKELLVDVENPGIKESRTISITRGV